VGLLADAEDGEWVGGAGRLEGYRLGGGVEEGAVDHVADLGGEAEEHCFDCWEGGYGSLCWVGWIGGSRFLTWESTGPWFRLRPAGRSWEFLEEVGSMAVAFPRA